MIPRLYSTYSFHITLNTHIILPLSLPFSYSIKQTRFTPLFKYTFFYMPQIISHNLCTIILGFSRRYIFLQISFPVFTCTSLSNAVHKLSFPGIHVLMLYLLPHTNIICNPIFSNIFFFIIKLFRPSKFIVIMKQNINFQFIFFFAIFC